MTLGIAWLAKSFAVHKVQGRKLCWLRPRYLQRTIILHRKNIAMRPSVLQDSTRLRVRKVKDLLLARHEQIKGSCKIFLVSDDSKNLNHQ